MMCVFNTIFSIYVVLLLYFINMIGKGSLVWNAALDRYVFPYPFEPHCT